MNQVDKDFIEDLSGYIGDVTPHDQSEDTTYTCRPEALKIAKIGFDKAVKEIDSVVRLHLKKLVSGAKSEEKKESLCGLSVPVHGRIVKDIVEFSIKGPGLVCRRRK